MALSPPHRKKNRSQRRVTSVGSEHTSHSQTRCQLSSLLCTGVPMLTTRFLGVEPAGDRLPPAFAHRPHSAAGLAVYPGSFFPAPAPSDQCCFESDEQSFPEIRMRNANQCARALLQRPAAQFCDAVLCGHVVRVGAGRGDDAVG